MNKTSKIDGNGQNLLKAIFALIGVVAIVFLPMVFISLHTSAHPNMANSGYTAALPFAVDSVKIYRESLDIADDHYNAVKNDLANEVDKYIKSVSKRSRMTGQTIVDKCLEYNYDIGLLMAQGHLETHFGAANKNLNVFGIKNKRYSHPDHAVDDYIRLMQSRYIINRTPEQLIASNFKLENGKGHYAGHASYGKTIGKFRNRIMNETMIYELFIKCQKLKNKRDSIKKQLDFHKKVKEDSIRILAGN